MKKLLFGAYFLSWVCLPAIAQDNTDGIRNKDFTLGVSHGFDYGSGWYKTDNPALTRQQDSLNSIMAPAVGHRICISALKATGYRTFVETGIQLNFKVHETTDQSITPDPAFPNERVTRSDLIRYNYLELPVGLHYIILDNRLRLTATAGIVPGLLLRSYLEQRFRVNDEIITSSGQAFPKFPGDKEYSLDGYAGIGLTYDVTGNLSLRLQPIYRQSLLSITEGPVNKYLYATGLQFSAFYLIERN